MPAAPILAAIRDPHDSVSPPLAGEGRRFAGEFPALISEFRREVGLLSPPRCAPRKPGTQKPLDFSNPQAEPNDFHPIKPVFAPCPPESARNIACLNGGQPDRKVFVFRGESPRNSPFFPLGTMTAKCPTNEPLGF